MSGADGTAFTPGPFWNGYGGGVVLLAGDLSYADGYMERWDSFGG